MPTEDGTLKPEEAGKIAANCYFTLQDWINEKPVAGVETCFNIHNRVLGQGNVGTNIKDVNPSLQSTGLKTANLGRIHSAQTGIHTTSGFGYTLTYQSPVKRHIIIATRGTRPELKGNPDLLTDMRCGGTLFEDFGPVHVGFKKTYDSILPSIKRDIGAIQQADVIHCVGHSLGGAVATLLAAHFAKSYGNVKLYTFGSPRVGCYGTYRALEKKIGIDNIFRVAHDLDPITLIAPYPYIHVQPAPNDKNNLTIVSPFGELISTANHDIYEYINYIRRLTTWANVRLASKQLDYNNALISRWLLHESRDPGWASYASAKALAVLFKLFDYHLKALSTSVIVGGTALDILTEILIKAINISTLLGKTVIRLLSYAATWAGIQANKAADFTFTVIRALLEKMLVSMRFLAASAIRRVPYNLTPMPIDLAGSWILTAASAF